MRRVAFLLAGLGVCAAVAAPVPKEPERKLGPEWVKEKDGEDYTRKLELTAVARAGQSGTLWYSLPLEDHRRDLIVNENFDFRGKTLTIRIPGQATPADKKGEKPWAVPPDDSALRFERTEGKDGRAVKNDVKLGKVRYFDLDGDGFFDAMVDKRDGKEDRSYILLSHPDGELELVRIWTLDRKLNLLPVTAEAYHSKTPYMFENGKWREGDVRGPPAARGGRQEGQGQGKRQGQVSRLTPADHSR